MSSTKKKSQTNKFFLITIGLLVIGIVISFGIRLNSPKKEESKTLPVKENENMVKFLCDSSKSITATFYPENDTRVDLKLSDGRKVSLPHAISGSGARYANADESMVFWNKGDTAFITEKDTTTFANCVTPGGTDTNQ